MPSLGETPDGVVEIPGYPHITRYETLSDVPAGVMMEEYGNGNGNGGC